MCIRDRVTYALATEVTSRERFMALALLQNRCNVNLYSTDVDERLNNVNNMGYIDYYSQMCIRDSYNLCYCLISEAYVYN